VPRRASSCAETACRQHRRQSLQGHAHHIVVWLLRGEEHPAVCVWKRSHHERGSGRRSARASRAPNTPRGAVLGDFLKEVVVGVEEEGQAWGKFVYRQAPIESSLDVGHAVGQRESQLLHAVEPASRM